MQITLTDRLIAIALLYRSVLLHSLVFKGRDPDWYTYDRMTAAVENQLELRIWFWMILNKPMKVKYYYLQKRRWMNRREKQTIENQRRDETSFEVGG